MSNRQLIRTMVPQQKSEFPSELPPAVRVIAASVHGHAMATVVISAESPRAAVQIER
ncbi:MAG: hypothetical protein ACKVP7_00655 [Hyphomicrobiaceae bacterium]